jgi:beta-lactamase class A
VGAQRTVRALIDQMIIHSDNTASDMLIDLVGLKAVNEVVQSLVPEGIGRITTLGDVRRQVYGQLTPAASRLSGVDLLAIHRERSDEARVRKMSQLLDVPVSRLRMPLEDAYTAYYASGVNSGRLDAYGELLALLVDGRALGRPMTDYLLQVMERTATGTRRIKAGLPPDARFAHKTGTQRRRICDAGLITTPRHADAARVLVVACVRGDRSLERSEGALQQVGAALCRSGLLTRGVPDAPTCPAAVPAAAPAAAR